MESAQERLNRDLLQIKDDRRIRGFDFMSIERRDRLYQPNTYEIESEFDIYDVNYEETYN